jgi:aminodeoxyfutalosine synthase
MSATIDILINNTADADLKNIAEKVKSGARITDDECLVLFEKGSLAFVGALANFIREKLHGDKTYFNRNFHIEPTNVCVFSCKFCSYSQLYAHKEEGWELSIDQMLDIVKTYDGKPITEVHIVGGVHPKMNMEYFIELMNYT